MRVAPKAGVTASADRMQGARPPRRGARAEGGRRPYISIWLEARPEEVSEVGWCCSFVCMQRFNGVLLCRGANAPHQPRTSMATYELPASRIISSTDLYEVLLQHERISRGHCQINEKDVSRSLRRPRWPHNGRKANSR